MNPSDYWNGTPDRSRTTVVTLPTECPECRSSAITTTAKKPDENTYWRCGGCGEVWNVSRRASVRSVGYRWR